MPDVLELIAEPSRRKILRMVWTEEKSAGDIAHAFDVTFGAVSQHLSVLRKAGLLDVRKEGRSRYYQARKVALGPLAKALEAMWSDALDRLRVLAESEEATPRVSGPKGRRVPGKAHTRNKANRKQK